MRTIRNCGSESTTRRRRRAASWLAGIAMPAIVAVQALAHEAWECGPLGFDTSVLACADPEFGTFELRGDDPSTSAIEGIGTEGS